MHYGLGQVGGGRELVSLMDRTWPLLGPYSGTTTGDRLHRAAWGLRESLDLYWEISSSTFRPISEVLTGEINAWAAEVNAFVRSTEPPARPAPAPPLPAVVAAPTNLMPWIAGGAAVLGIIGLVWWMRRR